MDIKEFVNQYYEDLTPEMILALDLVEKNIRNAVIDDVVSKSAKIREQLLKQSTDRFKRKTSTHTDNQAEKQWGYRKGIREFARAFGESLKADTNKPKKRGGCYPNE